MDLICEFHECLKIKTSIKTKGKDGSSKFKLYNHFPVNFI